MRCKQGNYIEAVGEELQRQSVMLASAIGDALDAVIKNEGRRCLVRRRSNLEAALENYERASVSLQQVADPDACEAATKDRRVLVDSSDDALDQIETLIEVKTEEKVVAAEVRLQGDKLEEIGAKVSVQMGDNKSLGPGEAVEIEVERHDMSEVEVGMEEKQCRGEGNPGGADKVAKVKLEEEFGVKEVEEPRIDKVEREFFAAKDEVSIGAKVLMGANEVRDPGDGGGQRWKWKEVRWLNVEVKQELDDVWRGAGLKLLDLLLHDAELVMLMSGLLRFVTAGCRRTPKTSSEYG